MPVNIYIVLKCILFLQNAGRIFENILKSEIYLYSLSSWMFKAFCKSFYKQKLLKYKADCNVIWDPTCLELTRGNYFNSLSYSTVEKLSTNVSNIIRHLVECLILRYYWSTNMSIIMRHYSLTLAEVSSFECYLS